MTQTQNTPAHHPTRRAARRVADMLRDLHREQVYAWECLCRASRAPAGPDRTGPAR